MSHRNKKNKYFTFFCKVDAVTRVTASGSYIAVASFQPSIAFMCLFRKLYYWLVHVNLLAFQLGTLGDLVLFFYNS